MAPVSAALGETPDAGERRLDRRRAVRIGARLAWRTPCRPASRFGTLLRRRGAAE